MAERIGQGKYFTLASAEERASKYSFQIPSRDTRENVKVGFLVKLIFESDDPPAKERMWVKVVSRKGAVYNGVLDSGPVIMTDFVFKGEGVRFTADHICDVSPPDKEE
jgi:uncharacterized protein YegJ (DUF2314 family)